MPKAEKKDVVPNGPTEGKYSSDVWLTPLSNPNPLRRVSALTPVSNLHSPNKRSASRSKNQDGYDL